MSRYEHEAWYQAEVKAYVEKYGDVPPPWVYAPDSHPYSMRWRMGSGETFIMVYGEWFGKHYQQEQQRIDYFKKYPAPPRWLGDVACAIWDLEPDDESFDFTLYFTKLKALGFEGTDDYQRDLDDEKWLNIENEL